MEQSPATHSRNNGHNAIQKTSQNRFVSKGVSLLLDLLDLDLYLLLCFYSFIKRWSFYVSVFAMNDEL